MNKRSTFARWLPLASLLVEAGVEGAGDVAEAGQPAAACAVGLDMSKVQAEKKTFLETVVPAWDKKK